MLRVLISLAAVLALVIWKWDELRRIIKSYIGEVDRTIPERVKNTIRSQRFKEAFRSASSPSQVSVYITRAGTSYHSAGCQSLKGEIRTLSLEEAKKRYTPCKRCNPPG